MFWHLLKYEIIITLRNKDYLMWLVLFPIILGTLFKVAFADIYNNDLAFNTVPVAVVQTYENPVFNDVIQKVSTGDEPIFDITECSKDEALSMLKNEDISGIIYTDNMSLTVSGEGIEQTIIKSFLEQYKIHESILDTAIHNTVDLSAVISALSANIQCNTYIPLTERRIDPFSSYFYNLIAMVALFGSMTGLHIAIENQANFSARGARNCCSPVNRMTSKFISLLGSFIAQSVCLVISVTYLAFVLNIDFADRLGYVYLASILGRCVGVSMGFFIGSIGKLSEAVKMSITMTVTMTSCFLSGLMIADLKGIFLLHAPWLNKINPAAVICDSIYCLVVYDDLTVFLEKAVTLVIMIIVFAFLGFILSRREKYASI